VGGHQYPTRKINQPVELSVEGLGGFTLAYAGNEEKAGRKNVGKVKKNSSGNKRKGCWRAPSSFKGEIMGWSMKSKCFG